MTEKEIIDYCLSFNGAFERYPFGPQPLVITIKNTKGFCYINQNTQPLHIVLKCDPSEAYYLRSIFKSIKPGYHFNKDHWNSVYIDGTLSAVQIKEMIKKSYELVAGYKKVEITNTNIAPCGINCSLCSGFQRTKNSCSGCTSSGNKPEYCRSCKIKNCTEERQNYCISCSKYPCSKLKGLAKRYSTKYGVDIYNNMKIISQKGIKHFVDQENVKWKCINCDTVLCMHKKNCNECNSVNTNYLGKET